MLICLTYMIQISTNGYITFRRRFSSWLPRPFPLRYRRRKILPIIAPLWEDNDPRSSTSGVFYRTYDVDDVDSVTSYVMGRTNHEINSAYPSVGFSCTWAMVVTWYNVPPYYYGYNRFNEVLGLISPYINYHCL